MLKKKPGGKPGCQEKPSQICLSLRWLPVNVYISQQGSSAENAAAGAGTALTGGVAITIMKIFVIVRTEVTFFEFFHQTFFFDGAAM
jgi:hypothetical protein